MHFLQQRYISGETVNSFRAGAILSPQLLQDRSHLKGVFTQPGDDDIQDFKSEGIFKLIQERLPTVTYPQSSLKNKTPEQMVYENCIDAIMAPVKETLAAVHFGDEYLFKQGENVAEIIPILPLFPYRAIEYAIRTLNQLMAQSNLDAAVPLLAAIQNELAEMEGTNETLGIPIYQQGQVVQYRSYCSNYQTQINNLREIQRLRNRIKVSSLGESSGRSHRSGPDQKFLATIAELTNSVTERELSEALHTTNRRGETKSKITRTRKKAVKGGSKSFNNKSAKFGALFAKMQKR
ncbi:hypothetical protein DID73_02455 [Candidatus Marinamargulisbacteria bacterium SCGC AG-343-K17]|nr:hypothetical protein DID73_02455 [Candidatus Marinamargulisbacteria bacterium SCGC AG-343-K17]